MRGNARTVAYLLTLKDAWRVSSLKRKLRVREKRIRGIMARAERVEIRARSARYEIEKGKFRNRPDKKELLGPLADILQEVKENKAEGMEVLRSIEEAMHNFSSQSMKDREVRIMLIESRILGLETQSDLAAATEENKAQ